MVCLALYFYGGPPFVEEPLVTWAVSVFGTTFTPDAAYSHFVALYAFVLHVAPLVIVTLAYAWTRRQPAPASAAG